MFGGLGRQQTWCTGVPSRLGAIHPEARVHETQVSDVMSCLLLIVGESLNRWSGSRAQCIRLVGSKYNHCRTLHGPDSAWIISSLKQSLDLLRIFPHMVIDYSSVIYWSTGCIFQ